MSKTRIIVDGEFRGGEISPALFGSFVEHMGRVVYSGIYEPEHPLADQDGFRTDVLKKVNEMGVSAIRYPGGNFVSNYNWLDGVGPRDQRPRKREVAWKSIETNQFGTDEFMHWISHTGAEPIFAVNLGTKGVENALSLLEYMNLPTGTFYSDLRAKNGHPKPYGVRKWCLGNEMDGIWQIGHKTAEEYGRLAAQTAHAMNSSRAEVLLLPCILIQIGSVLFWKILMNLSIILRFINIMETRSMAAQIFLRNRWIWTITLKRLPEYAGQ